MNSFIEKIQKEKTMKKNIFRVINLIIVFFILCSGLVAQLNPVKIKPDREIIYLDTEGPPSFNIETDPNVVVCIEVAIEKDLLLAQDKQKDDNFFSSYKGNKTIEGVKIEADNWGKAIYKLPKKALDALTGEKKMFNLYYRAYVIDPGDEDIEDEIKWETFSVINSEDLPIIEVYKEIGMRDANNCYKKGREFISQGEYENAIKEFESAYFFFPEPAYIYNIAICYVYLAHDTFRECSDYLEQSDDLRKRAEKNMEKLTDIVPSLKNIK
jgi:tetratricopeptide (TPR) repeat protein